LKTDSYAVKASWDLAATIKEKLRIPLLGNGDIMSAADAREKLGIVNGVLIGRGALANPFIFKEISGQAIVENDWRVFVRRLGELIEEHYPEKKHLAKIKAFTRFLMLGRSGSRTWKRRILLSQDFKEARSFLEENFAP
jgi:tRNA-dihydrouridine synthase